MDAAMLEDFGQKVDLTRRIREVLLNYPEGTTVLKELIQNADDAGATTVRLCLDRRRHGTASLLSEKLAQWQGPALLAYNDSVFTDDDFVSISRIGDSRKQREASKTGRFGVGFNSVYHLTDLPSFVSDKYVVLFDPQGGFLPNVSASNPGKRLEYVSASSISMYNDQLLPYCAFGCNMVNPFQGTLFRLPLRNLKQAEVSRLSRQAYTEDDICFLFSQLHKELALVMLFLKSILAVEMYIWDEDIEEPRKVYSCSVNSDANTTWHRQALLRHSNFHANGAVNIERDFFSLELLSEEFLETHSEKRTSNFLIVQHMAASSSRIGAFAASAVKEYDLHLLPWASVAACISDHVSEDDILKQGRAFCFLPLPVKTGLAVQVNGYFEVSSNRRSIWYGGDMDRGGKFRSNWNRLLLEDVVAPIFVELLLHARKVLGPSNLYYSLFPAGAFEEPWNILVNNMYKGICRSPVVYSYLEGGNWVSPSDAFFLDEELCRSCDLDPALLLLGMPVVHLPKLLVQKLSQYMDAFDQRVVSPDTVRSFLRKCQPLAENLSRNYKLVLLEYCLSDLSEDVIGRHLDGLPLLPLANGKFAAISEMSKKETYFICNEIEYKLLEPVYYKIIDHDIPPTIFDRLSSVARTCQANILIFNIQCFLKLLPEIFPADWRYKSRVSWPADSKDKMPATSWLLLFWKYLDTHCNDLTIFDDWPIFPSISGHLHRGSKSSKLINVDPLPDALKQLLMKVGCKVLNSSYGVKHQSLSDYIYNADCAGVVNAIFQAASADTDIKSLFHDITEEEKIGLSQFVLDPWWYYGGNLDENVLANCKHLPIYRTYGGGVTHSFHFSDLERPLKFLPPLDVPEYFLTDEFICCSSGSEQEILRRYYGIREMPKTVFYKTKVFTRIHNLASEVRDAIMISVLKELPQLCMEDPSFKSHLSSLEFVPTIIGTLKSPQSLYDPRVNELYALLEESDCFPCGAFQDYSVIDMLQCLGLRTSVSCDTIIMCARQIQSMMQMDQLKAHFRGKVLLSYLEVNASKWFYGSANQMQFKINRMLSKVSTAFRPRDNLVESDLENFWNELRLISWCPVLLTAPYTSLPWPSVSSVVAPPKLVRLQEDLWLVSASMRLLDGDCSSSALAFCLGWLSPPAGNVIAAQLLELGKNNEIVVDHVLRQELTLAMPKIYSLLLSLVGSDEMDLVKAVLEGCRWIWVGDGFAKVEEVVLNGHLHLAPYIRVIPIDLAVFRELFLELGVRDFLKPVDYANILCRMATRKGGAPLNTQELRTAVSVLHYLADHHSQDMGAVVYMPDTSYRLSPAKDLVFNDAPWLLDDNALEGTSNICLGLKRNNLKYVHGNISNDVAERLGVCSLRRLLLAESSDSMNLSLSGVAEAFGQHEALTTRLKHIVDMYADGPGILFELVQNAEDAGASEVAFLLDNTRYGTSSTLSPEMTEWQGPALYCFNNSVFSQQDLYAISRIGQDSKLEKPLAIGRFGLGFNCVYHFTDVPGFVSGENIVMFDPHACYLPGISPNHPGLRIRFVGRHILDQFPDQFSPFLKFGCDLHHPFPGTLFRFPLRGEIAAARSQIKKEMYTPEDVKSLFCSFSKVISETLIFLHNIKKISIYVKDVSDHEMQLIHCVSRHTLDRPGKELHMHQAMLSFLQKKNKSGLNRDQFFIKLGKISDKDLPWNCDKVAVVEKDTSNERSHVWMISDCVGGGRAKSRSLSSSDRAHNFIPWASVAAYLYTVDMKEPDDNSRNEEIANDIGYLAQPPGDFLLDLKELKGRAFCFLPLPISTGLPVHLNAYFELSSNRRDIWFGNDMAGGGKIRSDWNIFLLEDVVAPAYAHLLETVALEFGPCDLFFSLWPTVAVPEPWVGMIRKLYTYIADSGFHVLYTKARDGQWISSKQAIFPDFSFSKMVELSDALSQAGLPIITLPRPVLERFVDFCPSIVALSPRFLRTLLIRRNRTFKNHKEAVLILEYCLSDIEGGTSFDDLLGLPLIPLSNGSFTKFSNRKNEEIYVTSKEEYGLLKDSLSHLVVDCTISDMALKKLSYVAQFGNLNLSLFTCHTLVKLFPRLLPEWHHVKQVTWSPDEPGQPNLDWIRLLWTYLNSSCVDLSIFKNWPILPVGNNVLVQLVNNSNVIKDDGWSENMLSLLQKLGCFFMRSDLGIEHPQLNNFVQDATATGVLNALQAAAGACGDILELFVDISEGERRELRSFLLQSKWFSGITLDHHHLDIIKQLPIFESYCTRKIISLANPTKWLKPDGICEDILSDSFVRTESERERNVLRSQFEIREPTRYEFYKDHILNHMESFVSRPDAFTYIMFDLKFLIEEDASMRTLLSESPFVLAANGSWQCPSRLYDPRILGLQKLLHPKAFFPGDSFCNDEILDTLVCLGLKKTLGLCGLLDIASSVAMLHDSGDVNCVRYGKALLNYLNIVGSKLAVTVGDNNQHKKMDPLLVQEETVNYVESKLNDIEDDFDHWDMDGLLCLEVPVSKDVEDKFWEELKTIAWCPVYVNSPVNGMPWLKAQNQIASPINTRPKSQMWLVSATMRILDGECSSIYVQSKLGWTDPLNIRVLSSQLLELCKSYHDCKSHPDCKLVDAELHGEVVALYSELQKFIGTDDFCILKDCVGGVPWVWIGDNFISPKAVAFDSPVKYHPYLYVVPSELSTFRNLLLELDVKVTFNAVDYLQVLQNLQQDLNGRALSPEQLSFVHCVLEAISDCYQEQSPSIEFINSLLVPDHFGILRHSTDLIYNDAPWMEKSSPVRYFVHSSISNDLATNLGIQSLRSLSLVNNDTMIEIPCMDYAHVCDLLALYGDNEFLFFDLLELADCCNAKSVHFIYDKREHPRQSLLQQNLGEFQGPGLLAVMDGASLSREEICNLQFGPPWNVKGNTLNYGLGLLSCHYACDLLSVLSLGYLYMFDPLGLAFSSPASNNPSAKMFSLIGTNLIQRFQDQFRPMCSSDDMALLSSNSVVIRMPFSTKYISDTESGCKKIKQIFDKFKERASPSFLLLKSILQVSLSIWEREDSQPHLDFAISVDSSSPVTRNPFPEKKWRKFQISRLFGSSSAVTKLNVIDLHVFNRGKYVTDKWVTSLTLGSGQTRNMALDRKYLRYKLTPMAGVAVHISQDGQPINANTTSCILSPFPLSGSLNLPVSALGCFLVCHNGGRYLFMPGDYLPGTGYDARYRLMEAWNRELMSCIRDSYVELILELQKLRKDHLTAAFDAKSGYSLHFIVDAYGDKLYSFWPRSKQRIITDGGALVKMPEADWQCLVEHVIRPFYAQLVDLPVWQLFCGDVVKASEGMFLFSGTEADNDLPPAGVCNFIREHYPVFSVPSELVSEIQAIGIKVRKIQPKMVRDLLKSSASVLIHSLETYIDVLVYCLSDIQHKLLSISSGDNSLERCATMDQIQPNDSHNASKMSSFAPSSSNADMDGYHNFSSHNVNNNGSEALEIMSSFGKALFDFGRGVIEDIGRAGGPLMLKDPTAVGEMHLNQTYTSIVAEMKNVPLPTATMSLTRLGTAEFWVGSVDQQLLMHRLKHRFVHSLCLEHPTLSQFLSNQSVQSILKLQVFNLSHLSSNLRFLFSEKWMDYVNSRTPWVIWEKSDNPSSQEPSTEWVRLFWKVFREIEGDIVHVNDWPLIPAILSNPVLCRPRHRDMIFIPPITEVGGPNEILDMNSEGNNVLSCSIDGDKSNIMRLYLKSFETTSSRYPWLFALLEHFKIPICDMSIIDHDALVVCFPPHGQTLGQAIAGKLIACQRAGCFSEPDPFPNEHRDGLFSLFAMDFRSSESSKYTSEEIQVLRDLAIYKNTRGNYTKLSQGDCFLISSTGFFRPNCEQCLAIPDDDIVFLHALGVHQLHDQEILVRLALPGFQDKTLEEQEDILIYLYVNWDDLQSNSSVINLLKETNFVRNAEEQCNQFFKPQDLLDPCDTLLSSIFSGERRKFPGERFMTDGWLRILRKTGLRTLSEADVVVECAKKIELLGKESSNTVDYNEMYGSESSDHSSATSDLSSEVCSLAESLVAAIFMNFAVLFEKKFCDLLSKIAFIPAEKGFPSIGGKKGGRKLLCSYSDAILLKDWPLAWSCAPILSKQTVIPPEYSWSAFNLRTPPPFTFVLKHLQVIGKNNGEDTLAHWPSSLGVMTVEEASCEILKYLDKIWGSLSPSDVFELRKVPFLPVANGTRLVTVASLFVRLTFNLSPFAFELPACYLPYVKVLKDIGIQDVLTIAYAKDLLLSIQKSCGYQRLNPNELRAVMETLNFICDGAVQPRSDEKGLQDNAVVPDDGCRLVFASSCVYIDAYGSRFLSNIDTSRLRFVHHDLPENICVALGIKKLSDLVIEELDGSLELDALDRIDSATLKSITEKLLAGPLQEATWLAINSLMDQFPHLEGLTLENVSSSLRFMAEKLQFVKFLRTRFLLLPNFLDITRTSSNLRIPEWEDEMRHRAIYFVNRLKGQILIAEPPSYISIYDVIAIVTSLVLGLPITLPIGSLFSGPCDSEKAIRNVLGIGSEVKITGSRDNRNGFIGKELLPQDALKVQLLPLRPFYMGETVAWRTGKEGEKLKYGRVTQDVRPFAGQALYRFDVETAPGITQPLLSSQVFSFRSVSTDDGALASPQVSQHKVDNMSSEQSVEGSISTRATEQESHYGRVSAAELVRAVHDMLSAAGINMDTEKQTLLEANISFQERLEEAQVALLVEQEKADSALKEADAAKTAWSCRICLIAEVCVAIVPCGHVLCLRCSAAVSKCPFCRDQVSRTLRLYRP